MLEESEEFPNGIRRIPKFPQISEFTKFVNSNSTGQKCNSMQLEFANFNTETCNCLKPTCKNSRAVENFLLNKIRKMECCFHPLMEFLYLATAREMGRKKNTVILCLPLRFQSLFFSSLHEKLLLTLNPTLMESTELSESCQTWNSCLQDFLIVLVVGDLQQNMNDCPLTLWCPILIVCKNSLILRVWVNIFKLTGWGWVHACFSNWFQHCWRIC